MSRRGKLSIEHELIGYYWASSGEDKIVLDFYGCKSSPDYVNNLRRWRIWTPGLTSFCKSEAVAFPGAMHFNVIKTHTVQQRYHLCSWLTHSPYHASPKLLWEAATRFMFLLLLQGSGISLTLRIFCPHILNDLLSINFYFFFNYSGLVLRSINSLCVCSCLLVSGWEVQSLQNLWLSINCE